MGLPLDKPDPTCYNIHMKIKNIILISLALIFNDFVGSLIIALGILFVKLGNLVASLPTIF